jgi:soluble lytic murein transglycosylase-like protein
VRTRGPWAVVVSLVLLSVMGCSGDTAEADTASWDVPSAPATSAATPAAVTPLAHALGPASDPFPQPAAPETASTQQQRPAPAPDAEPPSQAPPPPPPRYEGECIAEYDGEAVSRSEAAAALAAAASRTYWPSSAPDIRIPETLLRAVAWQESGWQSNVIACDGGVGLMQVMPGTANWMNTRFGQSYAIDVHTDNAYLGATYLAWLTKYIGDWHFGGDYALDPARCASHLDPCLLNAVIAAYNFGHGAVAPYDPDREEWGELTIPNPRYVDNVRSLMTSCECLSY